MNATPRKTLHVFLPGADRLIYTSDDYHWQFLEDGTVVIYRNTNNEEVSLFSQIPYAVFKESKQCTFT